MTGLIAGLAFVITAKAQPGDVNDIDIRLVRVTNQNTLEVQLRPNATWTFDDGVLNLTFAIRWESTAGGSLGMPSQASPISTCMLTTPLVLNPGTGNMLNNTDAGDGYRYRGFNAQGGQMDGSCSFAANTWVPYARIPVQGIGACATFEVVATSAHTTTYNSNWFVSLGGVNIVANSSVVAPGITMGPEPQTGNYGPYCAGSGTIPLNGGVPAGGTWSGTGVGGSVPNQTFNTAAGTRTLVYTVTHAPGCTGIASTTIVVDNAPDLADAGADQSVCVSSADLQANEVFTGTGQWSVVNGSGVFANHLAYNTSVSGLSAGVNTFRWTIANGACTPSVDDVVITFSAIAAPTPGSYGPLCSNGTAITLGGTPSGGVWTGTGVSGSGPYTFNPAAGTQTLTYTVSSGGCSNSAQTTITVNSVPAAPTPGSYGPLCSNGIAITLGGTPSGGVWTGTGVSGSGPYTFNPAAGTQTLTISRKQFIGNLTQQPVQQRGYGTAGAVAVAVFKGARIIRVHDVGSMRDTVSVVSAVSRHARSHVGVSNA